MRIVWAWAQQIFATAALWTSLIWAVHATDGPPSLGAKLRATPSVGVTAGEISVWKRVALGTYKNVNLLREDLDSLDCGTVAVPQVASVAEVGIVAKKPGQPPCNLGDAAAEIIGRPAFALGKTKRGLDLVVVTPADLGLEGENVAVAAVYARAALLGFALCPAEVGPQLRLQYLDQPLGEALHIAMHPIPRYTGEPTTFALMNGGTGLLLIGGDGNLDLAVPKTRRFVFVRPRYDNDPGR
jgi:hypothetical protein